jgi:hypothetical protein
MSPSARQPWPTPWRWSPRYRRPRRCPPARPPPPAGGREPPGPGRHRLDRRPPPPPAVPRLGARHGDGAGPPPAQLGGRSARQPRWRRAPADRHAPARTTGAGNWDRLESALPVAGGYEPRLLCVNVYQHRRDGPECHGLRRGATTFGSPVCVSGRAERGAHARRAARCRRGGDRPSGSDLRRSRLCNATQAWRTAPAAVSRGQRSAIVASRLQVARATAGRRKAAGLPAPTPQSAWV